MAKVDQSSDCWRWAGSHTAAKRPQVNYEGRHWYVYRLLYTWRVGPIPDGLTLDHLCENGWCCNPSHCVPASRSANTRRELRVRYADRDSCPAGHPYSEHRRTRANGSTWCAECNRVKMAADYVAHPRPTSTTCKHGHPKSKYGKRYPKGWHCSECTRLRMAARRAAARL